MPCLPHLVHPVRRCSAPTKRLADVPQQYPWRLGSVACRGGPGCHWPCGCEQHLEQLCQSSCSSYWEIVLVSIVILNISKGNVLKSCKLTYLFPSGRRTGRCPFAVCPRSSTRQKGKVCRVSPIWHTANMPRRRRWVYRVPPAGHTANQRSLFFLFQYFSYKFMFVNFVCHILSLWQSIFDSLPKLIFPGFM